MTKINQQSSVSSGPALWLTPVEALALLALEDGAETSLALDLGRGTGATRVERRGDRLLLGAGELSRDALEPVAAGSPRIWRLEAGSLLPLEVRGRRYAVLRPGADAPLLELDGIQMHLARPGPWATTRRMAAAVRPAGRRVLDTCGGLGYVAIHAVAMGAASVTSVEACPEVREMRLANPWSAALAGPRIECLEGDVRDFAPAWPDAAFGAIVHDPPRMARATGDLYGAPWYAELFRLLEPGGLLLHYIGQPGIVRGTPSTARVPRRLQDAGIELVRKLEDIHSVLARRTQDRP